MITEHEDDEPKKVVIKKHKKCNSCSKKTSCIFVEMKMERYCDHGCKDKL